MSEADQKSTGNGCWHPPVEPQARLKQESQPVVLQISSGCFPQSGL